MGLPEVRNCARVPVSSINIGVLVRAATVDDAPASLAER